MRVLLVSAVAVWSGCAVSTDYDHAAELDVLAGGKADGNLPTKKWTFLLYGAADNNLADLILQDVNELESVGSTADVNLIAFLDRPAGANLYYLTKDSDASGLQSPSAAWGVVDSGDVNTLIDFAEWGLQNYPAERYALVISGHGGGSPRVIAPDDSTGNAIHAQSLESALHTITYNTHKRIETFGADACLMQTIELTYQLRYQARYIVASENTEPGSGWDYAAIASTLTGDPVDTWGYQLADAMIDHFEVSYGNTGNNATLAALSSDEFLRPPSGATDNGKNAQGWMTALGQQLVAHAATPTGRSELINIARTVRRVYGESDDYADLIDLLALLQQSSSQPLRDVAAQMTISARNLIATSWIDPAIASRVHGLSIYWPQSASAEDITAYSTYAFARELGWSDVMRAIHTP